MTRPADATHGGRITGYFYKADPLEPLNWLKWVDNAWVEVGTIPVGTIKPLCDVLDYATPTIVDARVPEAIFNNFGSNWQWASIDYRGVARVHTFQPSFTATGRIEMPRGKHNSQPVEAFDRLDGSGFPLWVKRNHRQLLRLPTDRFGRALPPGADPVEAADAAITNNLASAIAAGVFAKSMDNPKYQIARSERCRCTITPEQVAELVSRELGIDIDGDGAFSIHAHNEATGWALTVEWTRALS